MRFAQRLRHLYLFVVLVCLVAGTVPLQAQTKLTLRLGPITRIFIGTIRTMDAGNRTVDAAGVDARGLIVALGTEQEVLAAAKGKGERIRLKSGQVLLPGFFDAHLHLDALLLENSGLAANVGPCRPEPYKAGQSDDCRPYIKEAFKNLRDNLERYGSFVIGNSLDPSRQPFARGEDIDFKADPAAYIGKYVSETTPVLLMDQSGHFGYANHAAFRALRTHICKGAAKCDDFPPDLTDTEGGHWATKNATCDPKEISCYTGLLIEPPGYFAFMGAVGDSALQEYRTDPEKYVAGVGRGVIETLEQFRRAGITTVTSMSSSANAVTATATLAELDGSGTRMVSIVPPQVAKGMNGGEPIRPECWTMTKSSCTQFPRDLGVNGIKVIVDGSTQGCSAALLSPVSYQTASECKDPEGQANYTSWQKIRDELAELWQKRTWRFESHANGNRALDMVLATYRNLHEQWPTTHTTTVVHATVGDVTIWKRAEDLRVNQKLDLRFSHLIGHVAYWGDVLERQLGRKSAEGIDPTGMDKAHGIPFTLHSDATVSVPNPLWFIRQAVTRETWKYPELTPVPPLGTTQRTSILEALQAVTIRAAEEKELEQWLGSIEIGKVADFVVLSADPMDYEKDPTKISAIQVIDTYLGGKRTMPLVAAKAKRRR
jgi:predicted amidohydrolase YtcJ